MAILDFQSEQFKLLLIYKSLRYFQYKCIWPTQIGKQIWPWRQKGQMST